MEVYLLCEKEEQQKYIAKMERFRDALVGSRKRLPITVKQRSEECDSLELNVHFKRMKEDYEREMLN